MKRSSPVLRRNVPRGDGTLPPRSGVADLRTLLTLLILLIAAPAARGAVIEGVVLDLERLVPVPHAVVLFGMAKGVETDGEGRFRSGDLLAGKVLVRIEHVGYEIWTREVDLKEGQPASLIAHLLPRVQTLDPVEVITARPDASVPQGKRTIPSMQIRRAAGAVATDPLRVVQALPGVAAAGDDFSNRYVVRGGDPEESLVLVDGYALLQPIHLEGFTSVVYDDLIGGVEVYPGALPPRFGDALSSITSMSLLRPERSRRFFRYDLGSIALGGKSPGGRTEAIGAVRGSFYNLILRRPPGVKDRSFQDLSTKIVHRRRSFTLSLTSIVSRDREEGDFDRSVDASLVGVRMASERTTWAWHADASFATRDRTTRDDRPPSEIRADLERWAVATGYLREFHPRLQLRIDAEARSERFEDATDRYRSRGGFLSVEGTWAARSLALSFGGRAERIPFTDGNPISPYLSLRLRGLGRIVPGAGWRIVRQSPFHLHENPEVAGLPVDPGELLDAGRGVVVPLRAEHLSASCTADLGKGFAAGAEVYEKRYGRLLTWGGDGPDPETLRHDGTGEGRGIELGIRRNAGAIATGWLSFAISKTRKREGVSTAMRPADYDRPRMLQGALEIPVHGGTTFSLAYRAASGRTITPLVGTGDGGLVPGEVNSERLPSYRRFDVKLEHRIEGEKTSAFLYLDVLNLANRRNVVDVVQYVGAGGEVIRIYTQGVPILPVAGFGFYF